MKRVRSILPVALALTLFAPPAHAVGVNLAWDECVGGGGVMFRNFGCDTNVGTQVLVVSVRVPYALGQLVGMESEVQIHPTGALFPDWWRLRNQVGQANQCRNGALSASAEFPGLSGCADVYQGQAVGGVTGYTVGFSGANSARLTIEYSLPAEQAASLEPDVEYYTGRILITNAKTIGDGSCAGCMTGACITASSVRCIQPAGAGDLLLTQGDVSNTVGWHSVQWSDCGCAPAPQKVAGPSTCSVVCPVQASTWGQLKSLYR